MRIEYRLPRRRQPFFACVKAFMRLFHKRIRTVSLDGNLDEQCLYLVNHANKYGPILYELYFPVYNVKWGAHPMLGSYGDRRKYLRDVLYIQKNGYGRAKASFKSFFEAFFSAFFYKGMKMLPTYPDARLMKTVKISVEILNESAVMIFPEDSNAGYYDVIEKFFPGFVLVLEQYYRKNQKDIPIRASYYNKKRRLIVVDEPCYLQDLKQEGLDREEIAEALRVKVNALHDRIESGEFDTPKQKKKFAKQAKKAAKKTQKQAKKQK